MVDYADEDLIEGMEDGSDEVDDDVVPSCTGSDSLAPGCYSTVLSDDVYNYNPNTSNEFLNDDRYMLKTQMVPPVCPACPSVINGHSHDTEFDENTSNDYIRTRLCK